MRMEDETRETGEDIARRWLPAVIQGLAEYTDEDQQIRILELCGQSCAHYDLQMLKELKEVAADQKELLALMNEHIPWCEEWVWEEGRVHSICKGCGCPMIREGLLELSPVFCLCSRGYVKAIFSEAFGEDVEVELAKAIGRGDDCCEFFVHLDVGGIRSV
jgi:hypothetical protein